MSVRLAPSGCGYDAIERIVTQLCRVTFATHGKPQDTARQFVRGHLVRSMISNVDVCFGSKADVTLLNFDVRFTAESRHSFFRTGRADKRPRHFAMSRPGSAPGFGRSFRGRTAAVSDAH
jgi:hypothetical protein